MVSSLLRSEKLKNSIWMGLVFPTIFSVILATDLFTKYLAQKAFLLKDIPGDIHNYLSSSRHIFTFGSAHNWIDFSLTYTRNTGAAWGLFGNLPESIRPLFFFVLTLAAIALIIFFFIKTPASQRWTRFCFVLIFSGAVGNFVERAWLHYVRDWLHFKWNLFTWRYDYPVFNIADVAITSGVILLILGGLVTEIRLIKKKKRQKLSSRRHNF